MTNEKASVIIGNIPVYGDECYSIAEYQEAKTVAVQALLQEPFMNKPCVAHQICHENKVEVLDDIRAEIDRQHKWLLQAGYTAYNVDIAFDAIKAVIVESEVEE